MALEKMTNREQFLVLIVIATFLGGAYSLIRYVPKNKEIGTLKKNIERNKATIQAPKYPDEPDEDAEEMEETLEQLTQKLDLINNAYEIEKRKLAPADSVQDVLLRISESGRTSNVKIVENVPYIVQRVVVNKKEEVLPPVDIASRRKLAKAARKAAAKGQVTGGAQGAAPKEGELIYRLVNNFEDARPLHKISIEGGYKDIQVFIKALSNMQYQVTILKLDIEMKFQTPAQGVPQPLLAKMIIAF